MPVFEYVIVSHPDKGSEAIRVYPTACLARDVQEAKRLALARFVKEYLCGPESADIIEDVLREVEVLVRPFAYGG